MKKIGSFLRKYGFYMATGVICIGALVAIFLMPNQEGNIKNEANPYAKNEQTDANSLSQAQDESMTIVDEDDLDTTDEAITEPEVDENVEGNEESASITNQGSQTNEESAVATDENGQANSQVANESTNEQVANESTNEQVAPESAASETAEVKTENFASTTVPSNEEPFFAEGDTFVWPVEGSVVVPYTDESTKHWFSESLNQTMRTFGVCISGEEGSEVKAVAKGTVTQIVDDSSDYLEAGMSYVGKLMVIDHGNGYTTVYGFQGGQVNEELVGQVVDAGDTLGTIGSPKGAFISVGDNIYLQVMHNNKVVNPLNYLEVNSQEIKADGVDLGFAE